MSTILDVLTQTSPKEPFDTANSVIFFSSIIDRKCWTNWSYHHLVPCHVLLGREVGYLRHVLPANEQRHQRFLHKRRSEDCFVLDFHTNYEDEQIRCRVPPSLSQPIIGCHNSLQSANRISANMAKNAEITKYNTQNFCNFFGAFHTTIRRTFPTNRDRESILQDLQSLREERRCSYDVIFSWSQFQFRVNREQSPEDDLCAKNVVWIDEICPKSLKPKHNALMQKFDINTISSTDSKMFVAFRILSC